MTTDPNLDSPRTAVSNPPVQPMPANLGAGDVVRASAMPDLPAPERQLTKVAKLIDVSKCIGCKACQSACAEWNDTTPPIEHNVGVYENPSDLGPEMFTLMRFAEYENPETGNFEWLIRKDGCMHCEDPGCLKACPAPGAIVQYSNGIVDFIHENCIGCGYCISGCPFDIPRVSKVDHKSYKCTLCSDRVAVGQGPACAKACPTQAIVFGTKEDMITHANARVEDLKSRGYENAGIYDPAGVGGTHVFYVLQHADQPNLYSNLPEDPKISGVVQGWKGPTKTVGLAAIGLAAVGTLLHGLLGRANRVSAEDEVLAEELVETEQAQPQPREDV
ncbi:formate dehydrogenase subunit beta [Paracoccus sulfuroxidans]|uniref:Formate dehydrogenase (Quinone-dependent) iron-sulfur subunit n=1 Tax=Paracoccus sulfuroxidans TaxID=384678 RepID=A0A562NN11_9RHOB|nr:formate dehydrogenase subunit beta [Paracoccus sulfuroxidans]TWI33381.1 formate dehydrogenase (quinone-dependent) iron-sulfur subunit [Paracoccus sulfuroxidans]